MNVDWLLGFIEGEGCFCVTHTSKKYKGTLYHWPRAVFELTQIDRNILEEIKEFLAGRGITTYLYEQFDAKARKHKLYRLHCASKKSLQKLVELLDPLEWHTSKRQDFDRFKQRVIGDKAQ